MPNTPNNKPANATESTNAESTKATKSAKNIIKSAKKLLQLSTQTINPTLNSANPSAPESTGLESKKADSAKIDSMKLDSKKSDSGAPESKNIESKNADSINPTKKAAKMQNKKSSKASSNSANANAPKMPKTPKAPKSIKTALATNAQNATKPKKPKSPKPPKAKKPESTTPIITLKSGLNAISSFQTSAAKAQIKYKNRNDMALIFSPYPCVGAGVFTQNKVRAACVDFDANQLAQKSPIHAIVVNSGNANACTGAQGMRDCAECAITAGAVLGVESSSILLASTGVIGVPLPMPKVKKGISLLAQAKSSSRQSAKDAASAIMTTDTMPKEAAVEFIATSGKRVRVAGIAKGSGMIHPNMATMLCFVITNLNITQKLLQKALSKDVKDSFNMISVDGDTSTNDMVLALANGRAQNPLISDENDQDYQSFKKALKAITTTLARKVAQDGEGATKLITAHCQNASSKKSARKIAKSIIASSLVKAAMFGNDANWGRILCAMGYSGAEFDAKKVDLTIASKVGEVRIMRNGEAQTIDEKKAKKILAQKEVEILIDCKNGNKSATAWGCDLSYDYVKINADYRS